LIAKVSRRVAGGSFGRLAAYVSDLKKIGDLRDWRKTADYILDKKGGGERVEAIRVTNCHYEEPGMALAEIARTQECNTTNKVHPQSFRTVTPYFDQPRLQAACIELEKKHGLTPTNHQMPDRSQWAVKGRAEAMELHGKQQSLIQWVRDEAGPVLLAVQETGQGWQDLHRAAATYGLEIKPRGAGLIIAVAGEKYARVKPSEIDRRLSFGALTEKWGDYQAPKGPQPAPEKVYPRAPLHTPSPSTASLFRDFQRDRERALAERKTSRETTRATASAWRAEMADWAAERRAAIKAMPFTAEGRREAYAALKREKQLVMEREKARRGEERKQGLCRKFPEWSSFP
jgi:hypothetical protein